MERSKKKLFIFSLNDLMNFTTMSAGWDGMDGSMWDGYIYTFGSEHIERHACTGRDTKNNGISFNCFVFFMSIYRYMSFFFR